MRKILFFVLIISFVLPVLSQERAGNIYGKVVDRDGVPLPGVAVTLTGSLTSPVSQITTGEGNFRFLSIPPARDYALKAELQGFKTRTETGITTNVGANLNVIIVMEAGGLEEEVTVTAQIPLVDTKKTSTSMNVDKELLQSLPTARDTLSIMEFAPGVTPYKVFSGDTNTGMMNNAGARGTVDNSFGVYSIDGQMVEGGYYDMDQWEEVQISIGGADVTRRTGNLTMNMVTKRGGNNFNFGGRFFVSDRKFQADNLTDALRAEGIVGTNRIILNKDYGFNVGGPIVRDKAWFWMGYGVQDTNRRGITNSIEQYVLTTYNAKLNLQIMPQNRLELWFNTNEKKGFGRSTGPTDLIGYTQRAPWHFGLPTWRIGDEHMFGDSLFVSVSVLGGNAGLVLDPGNNENSQLIGIYNQGTGIWTRKADTYAESRPRYNINALATYFNDNILGVAHEIKGGYSWERVGVDAFSNYNVIKNIGYRTNTVDITGDGFPDVVPNIARLEFSRWGLNNYGRDLNGGYLSDTITKGPFTLILGFRYDYATLWVNPINVENSVLPDSQGWQTDFTAATADAVDVLIPRFSTSKIKPDYGWGFFSPRLGLTWDIGGKNKTVAKLTLSQYAGDGLLVGYGEAGNFLPLGTQASLDFWWLDDTADGIIDYRELYWHNSDTYAPYRAFDDGGGFVGDWNDMKNIMWGDFDPFNPIQTSTQTTVIDDSVRCERVRELGLSLEHEFFRDLSASAAFTYCVFDQPNWTLNYYPDTGTFASKDDYVQVGVVPDQVGPYDMGEGAGKPYYLLKAGVASTVYRIKMQRPDYGRNYSEFTLGVNKRMSHKWMANLSVTFCDDSVFFGENGYLNPTTNWSFEGQPSYSRMPRWMFKFQGLYRLPWGINASLTAYGREGFVVEEYVTIQDFNAPNSSNRSFNAYIGKYGDLRMDPFFSTSMRLEKAFRLGDKGTVYFMADIFSLFNSATIVSRSAKRLGTYYMHDGSFVPNPQSFVASETLAPRHTRFGIRFEF